MELAAAENTLLAFDPSIRIVPMTVTRSTASIIVYSAMSCPSSSTQSLRRALIVNLLRIGAFGGGANTVLLKHRSGVGVNPWSHKRGSGQGERATMPAVGDDPTALEPEEVYQQAFEAVAVTVRNLLMPWLLFLPAWIVLAGFLFWGFRTAFESEKRKGL